MTELLASKGLTLLSQAREGNATRYHVEREGVPCLLYTFEDEVHARRVAWAHDPQRAAQLFVVPEVLESGPGWCLLQNISGTPLAARMKPGDAIPPNIAQELGEIVRKLHSTNLTGESVFGDPLPEGPRWLTFNGYVAAQFERFAEDVRRLALDDELTTGIVQAIGQVRQELASFHPRSPTTLVHGKIDPEHVWVDGHGRSIVGLTGFDTCAFLPAEVDLAWVLWLEDFDGADLARPLYRGYGAARTMDVQRRERFYRRLVAFHALYGDFGDVRVARERLLAFVSAN